MTLSPPDGAASAVSGGGFSVDSSRLDYGASSGKSRAVTLSPPDGAASAVSDGGRDVYSSRLDNGAQQWSLGVTNERRNPDAASTL